MRRVILSFGANVRGRYGAPLDSLAIVVEQMALDECKFLLISSLYRSPVLGPSIQPRFYNFVALCETSYSAYKLLKVIKELERRHGRRGNLFWGPRPLDIDIIDFDGKILNWPVARTKKVKKQVMVRRVLPLRYPHKEMHKRVFVLKPLAEIMPFWRHPIYGLRPHALMGLNCSPLEVAGTEKLDILLKV